MFITVLHGEHKADIFNIHCKVQILLDGIKHRCGCEDEEEIDLADESGQVKNLLQNKHRSAIELLEERETYVLLGITITKLAAWQEQKKPSPRMKSKRAHRRSNLDIPAAVGLRNHSPHGSRTRTPIGSPKSSRKN
ncbi:uncharacterized protein CXorf65 homolog isoform X2 [Anolis carolinensis]|uniref:uncharacterized protein CXorf65 homolog isoform X2 n=1 Tax=Anolis carolinensis TaxID=28377 RepID=UPI0004627981|nr:PREDICTED: uncharacterized protein CXorf65 homolog [Anolis carolinensis]|eukprot:XP_008117726.1 PREDICTED: uncharacterized protein CXorf65 homolog [Anolis carolinensis]